MLTASRGLRAGGQAGEPINGVYTPLRATGVTLRKGQMCLVASAPNVGKSPFALNLVLSSGLRTFYFSADTDAFTQYARMVSIKTAIPLADIERSPDDFAQYARLVENLQFSFDANPSFDDLDEELKAYAMAWGAWPEIVVVDNLSNIYTGSDDRWAALEKSLDYLHDLGRKTGALILPLHHVTGEYETGTDPVPLAGLRGKISKTPEIVLTLHRRGDDMNPQMGVSVVKNRGGKADPSGSRYAVLSWDLERGKLS